MTFLPPIRKLKILDLFSGIGGFSLGLHRTGGFETVAFCENAEYPRKVLKKHWPDIPIYDDVRTLNAARLDSDGIARPDLICGGFPCQDISVAGKGAGLSGERSGLWFEYLRLIEEIRPSWVIAENVAILRSRGLDVVLRGLDAIGYDTEWHCIPASAVGAPHQRDRVWIVAYPSREQHEGCSVADGRQATEELPDTNDESRRRSDGEVADTRTSYCVRGSQGEDRGFCGDVAHTGSQHDWSSDTEPSARQEPELGDSGSSFDMADTDSARLEIGKSLSRDDGAQFPPIIRDSWSNGERGQPESYVGGVAYGLPAELDGDSGAEDQEEASGFWDEEPVGTPRVAGKVPWRQERLKALGNSLVPQIPELIGRHIIARPMSNRVSFPDAGVRDAVLQGEEVTV